MDADSFYRKLSNLSFKSIDRAMNLYLVLKGYRPAYLPEDIGPSETNKIDEILANFDISATLIDNLWFLHVEELPIRLDDEDRFDYIGRILGFICNDVNDPRPTRPLIKYGLSYTAKNYETEEEFYAESCNNIDAIHMDIDRNLDNFTKAGAEIDLDVYYMIKEHPTMFYWVEAFKSVNIDMLLRFRKEFCTEMNHFSALGSLLVYRSDIKKYFGYLAVIWIFMELVPINFQKYKPYEREAFIKSRNPTEFLYNLIDSIEKNELVTNKNAQRYENGIKAATELLLVIFERYSDHGSK